MKELIALKAEADQLDARNQPYVLATVVKVLGSAYRRPGARMLVTAEGQSVGTISGGCLEGEVVRQSLNILETRIPTVLPFEMGEDDHIMGFGTGCGGDVHVLLEPVPRPAHAHPVALLRTAFESRHTAVMATLIATPTDEALGQRGLYLHDGSTHGDPHLLALNLDPDLDLRAPQIRTAETGKGPVEILLEPLHPPIRLLIFGDGHDVAPVVRLAKETGRLVTVVGRKSRDALAERFPEADDHVFLMHPAEVGSYVEPDAWSAAVLMSHTYLRDRALLAELLPSEIRYVGALGPKHRTERMLEELEMQGVTFSSDQLDKLHGPVGLDIGTETPEEIALSILAEIQAIFHHRTGQPLREREGAIHDALTE